MTVENLKGEWTIYEPLLPFEQLRPKLSIAERFSPAAFDHIFPSLTLNQDGPVVSSVFMFGKEFVCELRVTSNIEFDFMQLRRLLNYRFLLWEQSIQKADGTQATYQMARVILSHGELQAFHSTLGYVGTARDSWLQRMVELVPVKMTLVE